MQMTGGHRAGDPAALEGVDAFAVQLDVGANQSRDFSGRLAVAGRRCAQCGRCRTCRQRCEAGALPERVVIAVVRKPAQVSECRSRAAGHRERFRAQKAQRRIRRRPRCQLLRRLQEALRIALLARCQRLVVERHRIGESRSCTEDEKLRDHCAHHSA